MKKGGKKAGRPAKGLKFSVGALIIALAVLLVAGCIAARWFGDKRLGNPSGDVDLFVKPGIAASDVLAELQPQMRRPRSLARMFSAKKVEQYMKPGHYHFDRYSSSVYIARALNNGWQTPVSLTLSGSLRLKGEIARKISSQMLLDSAAVASALNDKALLARYGFTPATVFALFVPDTYKIFWTASMEDVLDIQKAAYDAFWTAENDAKARRLGLSRMDVSILASIVKGESNYKPDFAKLAGVYVNRLRRGMRLQSCPTVAFVFDYKKNRILNADLRVDSPYNTYTHDGLPPGPISVPDKAYLEAVLNPSTAEGYLYFCASPSFDGTHRFARTFAEHSANAREYQRALDAQAARKR
ncbi:MAG: endolytic transglycosylase MltG [Bacteroidales bacterium]|nr:endolytic transglycosylase MltG [Bacteroidales bacterium]